MRSYGKKKDFPLIGNDRCNSEIKIASMSSFEIDSDSKIRIEVSFFFSTPENLHLSLISCPVWSDDEIELSYSYWGFQSPIPIDEWRFKKKTNEERLFVLPLIELPVTLSI